MRYFLAIILPWLALFLMGKIFQGLCCLILQITLIGWLPATLWALFATNNYYAQQRHDQAMTALTRRSV